MLLYHLNQAAASAAEKNHTKSTPLLSVEELDAIGDESMLYMKDEEFVRHIRSDGFVVLPNESLAEHYFQLLRSVFADLVLLKMKRSQYIYLAPCKSKVTAMLLDKHRILLPEVMENDKALKELGGG